MAVNDDIRRCLIECDVAGMRKLWGQVAPHLSQPASDHEALIALHHARTQAESVPIKLRLWSHRWLTERHFPSGLPDELRPRGEQVHPVVVEAVGICVKARSPERAPAAEFVREAMSGAVLEMYADKVRDPVRVKARMMECRARALESIYGRISERFARR